MLNVGDKIHSDSSGKTYTITWASEKITQAEVGFADSGGGPYFIKRHLQPKYPLDDAPLSPAMKEAKRKECEGLFKKNSEVYETVAKGCGEEGACAPILDYFREGSFYYTVYRKINADSLTIGQISDLPKNEKCSLLLSLVQGLKPLYTIGVIHGDLKPENILVQKKEDKWKIRLIDMDDCYKAGHPNDPGFVLGTIDYYSPELATYNYSEIEDREDPEEMARVRRMAADLTLKSDVFALGIIFCEFYGGEKPHSTEGKAYVYEAATKGCMELPASVTCDPKMSALVGRMLSKDYKSRPSLIQVEDELKKMILNKLSAPEIDFEALDEEGKSFNCTITTCSDGYLYYTLDGSEPGMTSTRYASPFKVPKYTTVKAIATDGKKQTETTTKVAWVKLEHTHSPNISVKGRDVTIHPHESSPTGTQIFYTLDGTTPTKSSALYSEPFAAPTGVTKIRAMAISPKALPSPVVEAKVYGIKVAKPIIHYKFGTVTMESPQGFNIYYSLDGSTPTKDSLKYTEPFEVANTKEFYVRAICSNGDGISEVEEIKRPTGIVMTSKK